jgi:hypothetical protein
MKITVTIPGVRVETSRGPFPPQVWVRIKNGDWIGDTGNRAGPELAQRFEHMSKRAEVMVETEEILGQRVSAYLPELGERSGEE